MTCVKECVQLICENARTLRTNPNVTTGERAVITALVAIPFASIALIALYLGGCGLYAYLPAATVGVPLLAIASAAAAIALLLSVRSPDNRDIDEATPATPATEVTTAAAAAAATASKPEAAPQPSTWLGFTFRVLTFNYLGVGFFI